MNRTGKLAPRLKYQTLRFKDFAVDLPAPPPTCDKLALASAKLPGNPPIEILMPMDGNDQYGDCVMAGVSHNVALCQGLIGKWDVLAKEKVIALYLQLTGGQDSGLVMLDTMDWWRKNRVAGDNILGYVKLDPHNHVHVKQCIDIFGSVLLGFQVQDNAMSDFEAGITWTPGKLLQEGHCVLAYKYDDPTVTVATWEKGQPGTWEWWDCCVDEAYGILTAECLVLGFNPNFDFAGFQKALKAVTA